MSAERAVRRPNLIVVRIQRRIQQELETGRDRQVLHELNAAEWLYGRLVSQRAIRRATIIR